MKVRFSPPTLAKLLQELLDEHNISRRSLAERCGVTYQTVKNVIDGKSVSMRFVLSLIREFQIDQNPPLLRRLLVAILLVQFPPEEGSLLLRTAGLLSKRELPASVPDVYGHRRIHKRSIPGRDARR